MKVRKVSPGSLRTIDAAVRKAGQGVRRLETSMRDGLTASVIGEEEEQGRQERTSGRPLDAVRGRGIKRIDRQAGYSHAGRWDLQFSHAKGSWSREAGTGMAERWMQEEAYRTTGLGNRRPQGGRHTEPGFREQDGRRPYPDGVTQGMKAGIKRRDAGTGRTIQRTEPSAGVLRRKTGQKTGTAMKWAGTSTGTAGVSKAAGTSVKGTAAAAKGTAAIASGAVTAGTSTAVSAVTIAAKVAKRAAERVQEALEASLAKSHASGTALTGQNQDGPLGYGKNGTQKGSGLAVLGIFSGILMLVLCTMLSVLLLLPLAMHQELEGQAGAEKGKQIVAVARQEAADAEKNIGGSKYKTWYGMDDNWCAIFVSWCASQCGYIEGGIIPKTASVANMKSWYQQRGLYFAKESGYEPKAGDVILFGNGRSHTGLVVDYDPETKTVTTIEGNTGTSDTTPYHKGSRVKEKRYPLTYRTIAGYGTPEYPADEEGTEEAGTEGVTETAGS